MTIEVWLDGKPVEKCISLDTREGKLTRFVMADYGIKMRNGELMTETLTGKIEVKIET